MNKSIMLTTLLLTGCGTDARVAVREELQHGLDGKDGHSAVFSSAAATKDQCSNGGYILLMGIDTNDSGALDIEDGNIHTMPICNGLNGSNGTNGTNGVDGVKGDKGDNGAPSGLTPTALINPCGDAPNIHDEVFIKTADGTIIASFSDSASGANTRFSVLKDGTYQTTDGDGCVFTLANGVITYENKHY